jgi:signal transduction histidine kinase
LQQKYNSLKESYDTDIIERKQTEEEIKLKNEQLLRINAEKDKFFSIIAHDLRSPFNGFLGLTQIMTDELPDLTMDEIQSIALSMKNSATNLFSLLENLLHWARIQQGLIPFTPEVVELLSVVNESLAIVMESAKSKGIVIACNVPGDIEVFADINALQVVIRNLVSNAVKFTHKDGKISVLAKTIGDKSVEISVQDTGIGMSRAMVDNLFRFDVQTGRKGIEGEPSTGLGLLLCKEFVEKHGGKLWAESEEVKGSVFHFTIPYIAGSKEISN